MSNNYKRLTRLAEDVFAVKNDPQQLDVNEKVIKRLHKIHPATVSEYVDGDGPVAWLLLIPTTTELMTKFLSGEISEKDLFEMTPLNTNYSALYLCSALVLEEYRRMGIIKQLALTAIEKIRKDHPIEHLFTWPFTREGAFASENISKLTGLPLYERQQEMH
jgi:hypothetical protein